MQHEESAVKIYVTKDYSRFNMVLGNRQLNETKIKNIRKDVANGLNMFRLCPIIVTEEGNKLNIQDGQHRFYVCRKMMLPIFYVLGSNMPLMDVAKVNSNQEKWNPKDFIHCYSVQGNQNYIKLTEFMEESGFPLTVAVKLLHGGYMLNEGTSGSVDKVVFERGGFVIKNGIIAREVAVMVRRFSQFKHHKTGGFVAAICKLMKADICDMDELVNKYLKDPDALKQQAKTQDYLLNLEQIYNKGAHSRRVIY